jgi:ATP-dependent helicase/DNAse subunit B
VATIIATEYSPWLVSTSQLKSWDKCKKQFLYKHVLKTNWLTTQKNFTLGKSVHKLMDYQARGLPIENLVAEARTDIQDTYLALEQHPLAHATVVANEWSFNVPFALSAPSTVPATRAPHVWLTGRIDRIVKTINNTPTTEPVYWIVDWKTGTAVPPDFKQAWQTRLYLYAIWEARQQLGIPHTARIEQLGFAYVEVKPKRKHPVKVYEVLYTQAAHQQTRMDLSSAISAMLAAKTFELPPTCPDSYCPFGTICGIAPPETEQLTLLPLPNKPVRRRKKQPTPTKTDVSTPPPVALPLEAEQPTATPSPFDWF